MRQTDIMHAMVGMLSAIPKTRPRAPERRGTTGSRRPALRHQRDSAGHEAGDELRDGYVAPDAELYEPGFYFQRLENLYL